MLPGCVHLNTQKREKNKLYANISKKEDTKTDLTDHLNKLQTEGTSTESAVQNLQDRGKEMNERCQKESFSGYYLSRQIMTWNKKRKVLKQKTR